MEHRAIKRSELIHVLPRLLHVQLTEAKELVDKLVMQKDLIIARPIDGHGKPIRKRGRPATRYVVRKELEELFEAIRRRKGTERHLRSR